MAMLQVTAMECRLLRGFFFWILPSSRFTRVKKPLLSSLTREFHPKTKALTTFYGAGSDR